MGAWAAVRWTVAATAVVMSGVDAACSDAGTDQAMCSDMIAEGENCRFFGLEKPKSSTPYGCQVPSFCGFENKKQCKSFGRCQWSKKKCGQIYTSTSSRPPNLIYVMVDDLGVGDAGWTKDPKPITKQTTPRMTKLAQSGIILDRHYAHWHCSPSRRSFLSGRLPIHTGEDLSSEFDDHMDTRWTWISEKLKRAGYYNVFYGKGHMGVRSTSLLPINRGFDEHLGMLGGYGNYRTNKRWKDDSLYKKDTSYSTMQVGKAIEDTLRSHFADEDPQPLFAFLAYQSPHSPIQCPEPDRYADERERYGYDGLTSCMDSMIRALDVEIGILEDTLREVNQWDNTLIVFTSDNGGSVRHNNQHGSNYPLRGEKSTSFEGGMNVAAFVSGGLIPSSLQGSRSDLLSHVSDWYTTFANLAGVDPNDSPPSPPQHEGLTRKDVEDIYNPSVNGENVWGPDSYPDVDGVDLWPHLLNQKAKANAAHSSLILSGEVILTPRFKLVTGQPCEISVTGTGPCIDLIEYSWVDKNDKWSSAPELKVPNKLRTDKCLQVIDFREPVENRPPIEPCLFDLYKDPRETKHANKAKRMNALWNELQDAMVYQYNTRIVGKKDGISPNGICSGWEFDTSKINNYYKPVCNN